jgi:hypothetical protein
MITAVRRLAKEARLVAEPAGTAGWRCACSAPASCPRPGRQWPFFPAATSTRACWQTSSLRTD